MLNNIFLIDNKDYIEKAKEVGINTFLFPFKGYAFGFNNYFELDEINEENSYIYINRNLYPGMSEEEFNFHKEHFISVLGRGIVGEYISVEVLFIFIIKLKSFLT